MNSPRRECFQVLARRDADDGAQRDVGGPRCRVRVRMGAYQGVAQDVVHRPVVARQGDGQVLLVRA